MPQLSERNKKKKKTESRLVKRVGVGTVIASSEQAPRGVIAVIRLNKSWPQVAERKQRSHINAVGLEGWRAADVNTAGGEIQQHALTL